jgi:YD repeat-containing protein
VLTVTNPENETTTYTYNARGQVLDFPRFDGHQ